LGIFRPPFGMGLARTGIFPFTSQEINPLETASAGFFLHEYRLPVNKYSKYIQILTDS
jgi:hypothetical protein